MKYNWINVPRHVTHIATDRLTGIAWGYTREPKRMEDEWISPDFTNVSINVKPFDGDWADSLEGRP